MSGAGSAFAWSIQPGMVLEVTGLDAAGVLATEQEMVRAATATTFSAVFQGGNPHGFRSIVGRGHPGPGMSLAAPGHDPALTPYVESIN